MAYQYSRRNRVNKPRRVKPLHELASRSEGGLGLLRRKPVRGWFYLMEAVPQYRVYFTVNLPALVDLIWGQIALIIITADA